MVALVATLAVPLLAPMAARAAVPPAGTVGPASPSASWTGQTFVVGATADPAACPPAADPAGLNALCDHYALNVSVAPSYWAANTGGVTVSITCPSASNDFDLHVYDANGALVGKSTSPTCTESVFIPNASGAYEVRVTPSTVIMSGYSGAATFASSPGGPVQGPPRDTAGLLFGPATVADAQRTEGEPLSVIDQSGAYWESGPFGASTNLSFIHRSVDRGDQFNIVSPVGARPDIPPGGGDTDVAVDDQGYAYFSDLEDLSGIGTGVSNDHGNTWRKNPVSAANAAIDRQWLAVDNGLTGAAGDNTVFLTFRQLGTGSYLYSSPGSTGSADPIGGFAYQPATALPATTISSGAPCGQLRFDPVRRNLYLPCGGGDHAVIAVGHVAPGQRTNIAFHTVATPASPGGGNVSNLFPVVSTDSAGNLYAVWIDRNDRNLYYSASTDAGEHFGPVIRINGGDANTNVMPWTQAGSAGTLVAVWYGTAAYLDPNLMPQWSVNRPASTAYPWFGYASVITNAVSATPSFAQARFTEKPMHYGQICTSGTLCATGGDRTMADYFAVTLDRDGSLRIVYNDTTSQHHGAHLFETRQLGGPTGIGTRISRPLPQNPMPDPTGDAQVPHYAPLTGAGSNQPQLDFTRLALGQPDLKTLRVQMSLSRLSTFVPPPGKTNAVWLTRFQALSRGDQGEDSYRIFYVGAESVAGGAPTFFAGSGTSSQGAVPGNGCVITTPDNCKIVEYPAETTARGSIDGDTFTIDVPLDGFGAGRPILGKTLYNVTALTFGRNLTATDLYADVDATRSFDFTLGQVTPRPRPCDGRHDKGSGETDEGNGKHGHFAFQCGDGGEKADYRDDGSGTDFRSTRVDSASSDPAAHSTTLTGLGINAGHLVTFTLVAVDNGVAGGSANLTLSDGTVLGGPVSAGSITLR